MPGTCHPPYKPPSSRNNTPIKASTSLLKLVAAPGAGGMGEKAKISVKNMKVRVICTDPDATDSSSDDEASMNRHSSSKTVKRVVRELVLPSSFSLLAPAGRPHGFSRERLIEMKSRPVRSSIRRCGNYVGVIRQKRCGKWAAEIRDSSRGVRRCLGTFGCPEVTTHAYVESEMKTKGSKAPFNFSKSVVEDHVGDETSCLTQDVDECLNDSIWDDSLSLPAMADDSGLLDLKECAVPFVVSTPCSSSVVLQENGGPVTSCSFMNSASSLLGPVLEDSDLSGFLSMPACSNGAPLEGHNGDISSDEGSVDSLAPALGYHDDSMLGIMERIIPSFGFMESPSCFDEAGKEYDLSVEEEVPDTSVRFGSRYSDGAGDVSDIDFELDPEALTWINVPESAWM